MRGHCFDFAGAQFEIGDDIGDCLRIQTEDGETAGVQFSRHINLAKNAVTTECRPGRERTDAWINGNSAGKVFLLIFDPDAKLGVIVGIIHGADEVEVSVFGPERPVLRDPFAAFGIFAEDGG